MAEAAVATVINKVVEIAANALLEAADRVSNLQENINWIESQMRTLQSYLKDAEFKKSQSHEVANLIVNIRDLAQDVEDILDSYIPEIERHNTKGPFHFLRHASCILCYGVTANKFALEIETIKKRAADLQVSITNCGVIADANIGANDDADILNSRKSFLRAPEFKVFGREETLRILEEKMLNDSMQCKIVSVVGPGGVGKTTIAKKIYEKVRNEFQSCAMVYVSQEPKVGELLLDIAKQVGLDEDKIKENLEENLNLFLEETRCAIFLDDIWDKKPWDLLSNVLPISSENGSRIIVTSRNIEVCRYIGGETSLVPLGFLNENEGNELFFNLMLPTSEEAYLSPILKDIGEKIVEKCGGLPLAIVVAVGMLRSREKSIHAWKQVLESMSARGEEDDCQKILAMSYHDLPIELKPLFLYFGVFPEDYEIFVSKLVHFWIAEKLVKVDVSRKPRDIVEDNIEKLFARNLIQVSKKRVDGTIESFRIHDLLHNMCVRFSENSNFFCTWDKLQSSDYASIVRRVTSNSKSLSEHQNLRVPRKLRALIWFRKDEQVLTFIKTSALDLKFLRFLIIDRSGHDKRFNLPNEIGKLSALIYLRLVGTFKEIPSSIGNLKKLETLEVLRSEGSWRSTRIRIPASVVQLKQLKHLMLWWVNIVEPSKSCLNSTTKGVELALPSLETLDFYGTDGYCLTPNSIKELSNLRKVRLLPCGVETLGVLFDSAPALQKLETFKYGKSMQAYGTLYISQSPNLSMSRLDLSPYQNLVKLYFSNNSHMPNTIQFPPNLVKIAFQGIGFEKYPMESLKGLSKLEIIKITFCVIDELDFSEENSFPQLQVLALCGVRFTKISMDEVAMPNLEKIIFAPWGRTDLRGIPDSLKKLIVFTDRPTY